MKKAVLFLIGIIMFFGCDPFLIAEYLEYKYSDRELYIEYDCKGGNFHIGDLKWGIPPRRNSMVGNISVNTNLKELLKEAVEEVEDHITVSEGKELAEELVKECKDTPKCKHSAKKTMIIKFNCGLVCKKEPLEKDFSCE